MTKYKNYGKILATLLLGIVYVSCKTDRKTTNVATTSIEVKSSNVANADIEVDTSYDHYETNGLSWLSVGNMDKINDSGSKMYLIDIYTEWCGWCKMMDRKTFSDSEVQNRLEEGFHLLKLDAESKSDLSFDGDQYKWRGQGTKGIHELAAKLMEGEIEYPTLIFLDENLNIVRVSRGYKNPTELIQELDMATRS